MVFRYYGKQNKYMKHYFNEGKEILNQVRSKEQYKSSMIGAAIGFAGIVISLILILIFK